MKLQHKLKAIEIYTKMRHGSCLRKKKYSQQDVEIAAQQYKQRSYECPRCQHWHLTTIT